MNNSPEKLQEFLVDFSLQHGGGCVSWLLIFVGVLLLGIFSATIHPQLPLLVYGVFLLIAGIIRIMDETL